MLDDDQLDEKIRNLTVDLLKVLHCYGLPHASVGGLMRLMGVSNKEASKHDEDVITLSEDFAKYINQLDEFKDAKVDNKFLH